MNVEHLYENYDVHTWIKYNPHEMHYCLYRPGEIAAGFKIVDVYHAFCHGRACLADMEVDNYGQLISKHDDLHLTYIRARFLMDALAFYNYCIDLSWQVVWVYYIEDKYEIINDEKEFLRAMNRCKLPELSYELTLLRKIKIRDHIVGFFDMHLTKLIREKYNYIKHRGTFYFEGLGRNSKRFSITVDNFAPKMLSREEWDINEWKSKLMEFDIAFKRYFDSIIRFIMPSGYKDETFHMFAPASYHTYLKNHFVNGLET